MTADRVKLSSGHSMPLLGLGTWQLTGDTCTDAVRKALKMGYRHIDTAEIYGNHREVAAGIRDFDREKIFLTSKVWSSDLAEDSVVAACRRALSQLDTDYLDLYLIHWPNEKFPIEDTMAGMKKLVDEGLVRSLGISNFTPGQTEEAIEASDVPIVTNQVEFHPYLFQKEMLSFCEKNKMIVTAYCPVARGEVMDDAVLGEIAERHGKTPAQVSLRWLVQQGVAVIPKSTSEKHLKENMDIFGWKLSSEDMKSIGSIKKEKRLVTMRFSRAVSTLGKIKMRFS